MNVQQINDQLKYGDSEIIANKVGCTAQYVRLVMTGKRSHASKKGKQIVEVARTLIRTREQVEKQIKNIPLI